MHIKGILAVIALSIALQGCGSDSDHSREQYAEAVYPAGIQSMSEDSQKAGNPPYSGCFEIEPKI